MRTRNEEFELVKVCVRKAVGKVFSNYPNLRGRVYEDLDDIFTDVYMTLLHRDCFNRWSPKRGSNFEGYVYASVRNALVDVRRKMVREVRDSAKEYSLDWVDEGGRGMQVAAEYNGCSASDGVMAEVERLLRGMNVKFRICKDVTYSDVFDGLCSGLSEQELARLARCTKKGLGAYIRTLKRCLYQGVERMRYLVTEDLLW